MSLKQVDFGQVFALFSGSDDSDRDPSPHKTMRARTAFRSAPCKKGKEAPRSCFSDSSESEREEGGQTRTPPMLQERAWFSATRQGDPPVLTLQGNFTSPPAESDGLQAAPEENRTPLKKCFEEGGRDKEGGALKSGEVTLDVAGALFC